MATRVTNTGSADFQKAATDHFYKDMPDGWNLAKVSAIFFETAGKTLQVGSYGTAIYSFTFLNPVTMVINTFSEIAKAIAKPFSPIENIKAISEIIFGNRVPDAYTGIFPFIQAHPFIATFCLYYAGKVLIETGRNILETDRRINLKV